MVVALTHSVGACTDQSAQHGDAYARRFSLPAIADASSPELRIWTQDYEGMRVTGYVVRSGEIRMYREPGSESAVTAISSEELIRLMPQLRRARVGRCQPVADGGGVVIEGIDQDGVFSFAAQNHEYCEGWNLHVVNRALCLAQGATQHRP